MPKICLPKKIFLVLIISAVFLLSGCQGGINFNQIPGFNISPKNNLADKVFSQTASLVSEEKTLEESSQTSAENQSDNNPIEESTAANEETEENAPAADEN